MATAAFYYGPPCLAYLPVFDRYYLTLIPVAMVLIWQGFRTTGLAALTGATVVYRPAGIAAGLIGLMALLVYSAAGTHDYLDLNRQRWSELQRLTAQQAIPATEIDGGWEYNNLLVQGERLYKNDHECSLMLTPEERSGRIGNFLLNRNYRIAVSPAAGYEVVREVFLSPWLPLAPSKLVVLKKLGTTPASR